MDIQDTNDITEGVGGCPTHLLDKSYEENAKLGIRLQEERVKTQKAQYAEQEAKRRYNELVDMIRFSYPEE